MEKKKKIILIFVIFIVLIGIIITTILLLNHKQEDENNIIANSIECLQVLKSEDPAQSALLIKKNIVKITNKIDDETKIVGTGFFHESGYLITNSHIVDIKGEITIQYYDNSESKAILVSNDLTSDIAILSVDSPKALAMSFANTLNLDVTDEVYGIGYAYDLEGEASVSKGILSARRSAGGIEFLQSDISLNSGNSGGPLINDKAQLLGINTYATENSSISMAISSESLEIIINKLINNKQVNYLTKEREANALSVALKEIGYKIKDIYEESNIISKIFNSGSSDEKNNDSNNESNSVNSNSDINNKANNNKSSDSRLSSLTVDGHLINFSPDKLSYCILIRNKNESTLNINAIPNESESKITIKNNNIDKGKTNEISIDVLAPNNVNGHVYDIYAISTNDVLEPNRLSKIELQSDIKYVNSAGANYYKIYWYYTDKDGVIIIFDRDNITSIVSSYTIDVYVKRYINDEENMSQEERLLKSYTFNGSGIDFDYGASYCDDTIKQESAYIKVDEIRSLLNDEDYNGSSAEIIFKASINTYHQGTFKDETTRFLNK